MGQAKRWGTALFVTIGLFGVTRSAHADDFYFGVDIAQARIEWCNHTTGVAVVINPGRILAANTTVNLTAGNDRGQIVRANFTATACGLYNPILFNGFTVAMNGLAGNDILTGGFGSSILIGSTGDDHLTVLSALGNAQGMDQNDCVASNVAGGGEDLIGGNGADCLEQQNAGAAAATTFNCGAAIDNFDPGPGTVPVGCDVLVAACGCLLF